MLQWYNYTYRKCCVLLKICKMESLSQKECVYEMFTRCCQTVLQKDGSHTYFFPNEWVFSLFSVLSSYFFSPSSPKLLLPSNIPANLIWIMSYLNSWIGECEWVLSPKEWDIRQDQLRKANGRKTIQGNSHPLSYDLWNIKYDLKLLHMKTVN